MKQLSIFLLAIAFSATSYSQNVQYSSTNGIAIKGYDPVAYFTLQKPTEGSDTFTMQWSGATWKFATQQNLDLFKQAPEKYAPQYGGYCAYGCSENHKAPTDPKAWTIVDNKLYLNYNTKVQSFWIKDSANRIKAANANWPALNK